MAGTSGGQRETFLDGAVAHVLVQGVATLSLRPLAAALGTSDRMLLYYFHSRDELLAAVLARVGDQLRVGLEEALPPDRLAPAALVDRAWAALREPAAEPHRRLYVEVSGLAARGREPYRAVAAQVARQWLDWIEARLDVPAGERASAAAGLLTVLDGLLLVRFVASQESAAAAFGWLAPRLG
jgi:AcrR family transcriptional regulator